MNSIIKEIKINSTIEKVWDALTNAKTIEKWSGTKAVMEPKVDFEFKLWDGDIYGKNVEVKENEYLKQEWYGGDWELPSFVTFRLEKVGDSTLLKLDHTNLPEGTVEEFDKGWDDYYLSAIKELLES